MGAAWRPAAAQATPVRSRTIIWCISRIGPKTSHVAKALPPGVELNVDQGKAIPPGIESKVGPITPDVDTPAEKALSPGQELNLDLGKLVVPDNITLDKDDGHPKPASDGAEPIGNVNSR